MRRLGKASPRPPVDRTLPLTVQRIMLRVGLIATIVCPFWAKSGKYYSNKRGNLMQLRKERSVIALGLYLVRGKLQLLQASVNTL